MERTNKTKKEVFLKAYDQYADSLFKFAYFKTSDRDVAKDITQETFTKTWEFLQKGEEVLNLRSFLYQVMRNIIIDYYRKKKSLSLDKQLEQGIDVSETNKESQVYERSEEKEAIRKLNSLEEMYREILELRFIQDLSVNEIAEMLKVSPNVVSVRINRGLEKLRQAMKANI